MFISFVFKDHFLKGSKRGNKGKQVDVNADSPKSSSSSKQRMNAWQVTFIRNSERATGQKSNIRTEPSKKELEQSQILGGAGYVLHLCDLNLKAASIQESPHCVYRTGLEIEGAQILIRRARAVDRLNYLEK